LTSTKVKTGLFETAYSIELNVKKSWSIFYMVV